MLRVCVLQCMNKWHMRAGTCTIELDALPTTILSLWHVVHDTCRATPTFVLREQKQRGEIKVSINNNDDDVSLTFHRRRRRLQKYKFRGNLLFEFFVCTSQLTFSWLILRANDQLALIVAAQEGYLEKRERELFQTVKKSWSENLTFPQMTIGNFHLDPRCWEVYFTFYPWYSQWIKAKMSTHPMVYCTIYIPFRSTFMVFC